MEDIIEKAQKTLKQYNQKSVLKLFNNLDEEKKEILAKSILDIDFEYITNVYKESMKKLEVDETGIEPKKALVKANMTDEEKEVLYALGKKVIQSGEYAIITMAGGQGTRLNHKGPKGTFKLQTINGEKYIFEILCETLQRANKKFGVEIPWYIMTSEDNNDETVKFFEDHKYFGCNPNSVHFFKQSKLPILSEKGEVLVGEDYRVKQAADGNGGMFSSLRRNGILDEFKEKGIKWAFSCGVDNILVNMADPYLIGLALNNNCEIATKTVIKEYPQEKLGVVCKKNNRVKVIEYIELPTEMAEQTDENGELLYGEAHIMFNLFSLKALEESATYKMPYHVAHKKNNYLDENGNLVEATEPNSYKFEAFIFDSFELFDDIAILRGKREDEFSPIKNATGVDSPFTAVKMYNDFWSRANSGDAL